MSGLTYRTMSRIRHLFGLHNPADFWDLAPCCDWCGHRSAIQRAVTIANAEAAAERQLREEAKRREQWARVAEELEDDTEGDE